MLECQVVVVVIVAWGPVGVWVYCDESAGIDPKLGVLLKEFQHHHVIAVRSPPSWLLVAL
jgi:hypothetical protein